MDGTDERDEVFSWLWEPWIPNGALTLIAGKPEKGKSTLLAHIAAGVSLRPAAVEGGQDSGHRVLWVNGEESWKYATRPRLKAAGADLSRLIRPTPLRTKEEKVTAISLAAEFGDLVKAGVGLVVIDPLAALCAEGSDWNTEGAARATLDLLQELAGNSGIPILTTRNWNKRKSSGDRLERIMGSAAFRDAPRAVLSCIDDPLVKGQYVLCLDKKSHGPGARPISYRLTCERKGTCPVWEQLGEHRMQEEDLEDERPRGSERTQWRAAHTLLRALLSEAEVEVRKIRAEAEASGIKATTLWRAATELGVSMRRSGFGASGTGYWGPPEKGWPNDLPLHRIGTKRRGGGVCAGVDGRSGTDGKPSD